MADKEDQRLRGGDRIVITVKFTTAVNITTSEHYHNPTSSLIAKKCIIDCKHAATCVADIG